MLKMNSFSKVTRVIAGILLVAMMVTVLGMGFTSRAAGTPDVQTRNTESGYDIYIFDEADLLTSSEEASLTEVMKQLSEYGNVIFYTVNENNTTSELKAQELYFDLYGGKTQSGSVFIIDMDNRYLYLYNAGSSKSDLSYKITSAKSNSIVDNVYTYASAGNYYQCAFQVFSQEVKFMEGRKINEPMRRVCNIFLAIILGFIFTYFIAKATSATSAPSEKEVLAAIQTRQRMLDYSYIFTHQTRRYSPQSSSSSGGGGGGGGGGHSSGGGHSF